MESEKLIFKKLCAINKEVEAIKKLEKNQQQGFLYRGIDSVMNELHDLFAKHSVFISSESIERSVFERQTQKGGVLFYVTEKMKFTFYAEDGSSISSTIDGEAMDSGDKATNKAMSIALKYCLLQMFLIPTNEEKDPDANTPEPIKPDSTNQNNIKKAVANSNQFQKIIDKIKATPEQKGEIVSKYETAFTFTESQLKTLENL